MREREFSSTSHIYWTGPYLVRGMVDCQEENLPGETQTTGEEITNCHCHCHRHDTLEVSKALLRTFGGILH